MIKVPSLVFDIELTSDVKVACPHAKDGQDTARLVSILSALGYKCSLRTALGGGDGADCLRNLRHTFITCETPAGSAGPGRRYIVDPQFKEQFIIAKTTARYAAILAAIPSVFVGPEEHLCLLVNFLCTEMSTAFRQLGSVLPPWRQASSMLSKWKPRKSLDEGGLLMRAAAAAGAGAGGGLVPVGPIAAVGPELSRGAGLGVLEPPSVAPGQPLVMACKPAAAPLQSRNSAQLHHWQQAAMVQQLVAGATAAAASKRPSYEPQRVVFGGNFIPIVPAPSPVS
ncbi:hypothetical protein GPECTOR_67g332 [Gonium pectorale]|uniref:Uncharacterized protein n=1 Tax=Gonium pectorale TaxID=33097 RepID=A0A150G3U5_GONPE|nr:hypothetical protein GPECTOR_67g332 [Gonium pectorale]|eukprot:KXZ44491.1 hypothetical protein GPECTOR_67g332 [Gonium pectorale]